MLSKRNLAILLATLAIAGGAYELSHNGSNDKQRHAHGDTASHLHDENPSDNDAHAHDDQGEHVQESTISDAAAQKLKIEVLKAGSAYIEDTIRVTGRVTFNQNTTAQVKARFPGIIRSVAKEPGEEVKAGDTLATVESNDSLQVYPVTSPVAGTIISRNANIGELAADTPLFVVADLSRLWAELHVFSKDGEKLRTGQKVRIQCLDDPVSAESTISLVLPATDASSQTVVARAIIENANQHWRAGMTIRAEVVMQEKEVPLAVKSEAIQRMNGKNVVFIRNERGAYQAQPVELGVNDATWTEIRNGLEAGQFYVAKNSFIIKADIGKASAEHDH